MKINLSIKFLGIIAALGLIFTACKKDNDELSEGFSEDIKNFVPDSTIQKMRELGMVINEGKVPPAIEGYYLASPNIMINSNVPNETHSIGNRFIDYQYRFYEQNNDELSIKLASKGINDYGSVIDESAGDGAFLSGYGDSFTAFLVQDGFALTNSSDSAFYQMLQVISGTITEDGIDDFYSTIWMLNDYEDPYDYFIPINSGRVFMDSDTIAYVVTNPKSGIVDELIEKSLPVSLEK